MGGLFSYDISAFITQDKVKPVEEIDRVLEELYQANLDSELQERAAVLLAAHKDISFLAKEFDRNEVTVVLALFVMYLCACVRVRVLRLCVCVQTWTRSCKSALRCCWLLILAS